MKLSEKEKEYCRALIKKKVDRKIEQLNESNTMYLTEIRRQARIAALEELGVDGHLLKSQNTLAQLSVRAGCRARRPLLPRLG